MAICLPVLLIFLFGGYELGRANMLLHATESAAYEGARVGILPGATAEKVDEACREILASVGIRDATVTVTPRNIQADTPRVNVEIDVPLRTNASLSSFFLREPVFRGACELTRETL